ncbi:haloacid dehalogenase type II [Shewanella sp. GXUN23E]|uniref:haloacid dehalogenase type II n=1 Tax=Shewanella sp. GXUN23E TaxID=3422498 RepID=UPI003D7ED312
MPRDTLLFDINESTLNLNNLKPLFKDAFGDEERMSLWFFTLLHTSTVCALTGVKTDFASLARAALASLEVRFDRPLSDQQRNGIIEAFAAMPPHGDMPAALKQLRQAGYRIIAFTNSSLNFVKMQINNAGLADDFDDYVSVEQIGSFKPDLKAYQYVASAVNRPLSELRLIATHDWDTHGALSAGMQAAYIDRTHLPYNPYYLRPEICEQQMDTLVQRIIAADKHR